MASSLRKWRSRPRTIVGVVSDAVYNSLRDPMPPTIYVPLTTAPSTLNISVRVASGAPASLSRSIATAAINVNRDLAFSFRPLGEQVGASIVQGAPRRDPVGVLRRPRAGARRARLIRCHVLLGQPASHGVGIRMALGAAPAGVVRLVLARVSMLIGAGLVVGVAASAWASTFVASLLYGLEPRDPATLVGAALTLAAVGPVAGGLPAWRASQIDPAAVIRES